MRVLGNVRDEDFEQLILLTLEAAARCHQGQLTKIDVCQVRLRVQYPLACLETREVSVPIQCQRATQSDLVHLIVVSWSQTEPLQDGIDHLKRMALLIHHAPELLLLCGG